MSAASAAALPLLGVTFNYTQDAAQWTRAMVGCIVHLKGFAQTLLPSPGFPTLSAPLGLQAALLAADTIVWDGDDYHPLSFTSALPAALARSQPPVLLALASTSAQQQAAFEASWRTAPLPAGTSILCLQVQESALGSVDLEAAVQAVPALAQLVPPESVTAEQLKYAALGLLGVQLSADAAAAAAAAAPALTAEGGGAGALAEEAQQEGGPAAAGSAAPTVLCWGGGAVPALEFAAGLQALGERSPLWRYFHAQRQRLVQGAQQVQQGLLAGLQHPRLHPAPLFSFGLIADVQYANREDGASWDGTERRHYRGTLQHARAAAAQFAAQGVSCVVQLGDLVDGLNNSGAGAGAGGSQAQPEACAASVEACSAALAALSSERYSLLHVRGNHDNYNFSTAEQQRLLPLPSSAQPYPDPECCYYAASPHPGWLFLVLDAYDVSLARPRGHPGFCEAQRLLRAHNPNPSAWGELDSPKGNYFQGIRGTPASRFVPFNGGLGEGQLAWLRGSLAAAQAAGQRVAVFSHVPFNPSSTCLYEETVWSTLLFNYEEALAALAPYAGSTVAAVFCGHNHGGSIGCDAAGIPHFTLPSPLIFPHGSHLTVEVHPHALRLRASGECVNLVHPDVCPSHPEFPCVPHPHAALKDRVGMTQGGSMPLREE